MKKVWTAIKDWIDDSLGAIVSVAIIIFLLAGIVFFGFLIYRAPSPSFEESKGTMEMITMDDTRRVPCVVQNGKIVSCDWLHADGADKVE